MSTHTRQRYWRLLRGVFFWGYKQGWLAHPVVVDVAQTQRPVLQQRDRQAQVLPPQVWARLQNPATVGRLIDASNPAQWWYVRDRALLATLVCTGLTTRELVALRAQDVRSPQTQAPVVGVGGVVGMNGVLGLDWGDAGGRGDLLLDVMASSRKVQRTLVLRAEMAVWLWRWLAVRTQLLQERMALQPQVAQEPVGWMDVRAQLMQGPLFPARRRRDSGEPLPPMTAVSVYHNVSQSLRLLNQQAGFGLPDGDAPYVAKGAAILRNTVLAQWLQEVGVPETLKRSGLRDERSLRVGLQAQ